MIRSQDHATRPKAEGLRPKAILLVLALAGGWVSTPAREPAGKPVSFAILEDYDKGQDLADVERDFALFDELEIRAWRGSFGWDDYEPARRRYDFDWLHRFARLAADHGIELKPYLAYTPEWAARRVLSRDGDAWNDPPARVSDFARFAGEVASVMERHENVTSFEIYNEQNVTQWWEGTAVHYAQVLRAASRKIRHEQPGARVLLGGLVFPDAEWIEQVCDGGDAGLSFDVLPVHAYPETWTPPEVTVENYLGGLDEFVAAADAGCGRKPIWINETGFATVPGRTERGQAAWWVRAVATFLAHPRVEHIGIYEIKDLAPGKEVIGDLPNYHLGLTRADRSRKLAFHTVDMLTDLLDVGRLTVADDEIEVHATAGQEVFAHLFIRPDGDRVLIAWVRSGTARGMLAIRGAGGTVTEYMPDGNTRHVRTERGRIPLELSPDAPRVYRITEN